MGSKADLTQEEMLDRVPEKDILSTKEVQHIFGDIHEVTVYKWVKAKELPAHRVRARGRANVFKREDVLALIAKRFSLRPRASDEPDDPIEDNGNTNAPNHGPGRTPPRTPGVGRKKA